MPHSIADAFLSQFPKGVSPMVDTVKLFQNIQKKHAEQEKQQPQQSPSPPVPTQSLQGGTVTGTAQGPTPQAIPPEQAVPPEEEKSGRGNIIQLLARLGIPVGAAIAGSVNPNFLPQAAGLSTGFTEEISRQDVQRSKLGISTEKKSEAKRKEEKRDRKDIRREAERAVDKSKEFIPTTADRQRMINELEKAMLRERGMLGTERIVKEVTEKFLPPKGAPSAKGRADGSKLKNDSGQVVAIARDGQWVSP